MAETNKPNVPDGQVQVRGMIWKGERWLQVAIGRRNFTKVFNLRVSEARQVVEQISAQLP